MAGRRARKLVGGLGAAAFLGLPVPLPPLPLPIALPSPSLPVGSPVAPPLSPVTIAQQSPAATPKSSGQPAASPLQAAPRSQDQRHRVAIPFTAIYFDAPLSVALLVALAVLPLLAGIWLLLFGRTVNEARRVRDAQVRLMLAADLGLRPRDLASMTTSSLFNLREKAAFDELTGVLRRAAGISAAEREIARAKRHGTALSVAFVDVDGLKEANNESGNTAGDDVLRGLVGALKTGLREDDVVMRYGGDEFVCVLPETTAKAARSRLDDIQVEAAKAGVRFSAGVAELLRNDDVVSLFARADRDLYDFKVNRGEIVQLPRQPKDTRPISA